MRSSTKWLSVMARKFSKSHLPVYVGVEDLGLESDNRRCQGVLLWNTEAELKDALLVWRILGSLTIQYCRVQERERIDRATSTRRPSCTLTTWPPRNYPQRVSYLEKSFPRVYVGFVGLQLYAGVLFKPGNLLELLRTSASKPGTTCFAVYPCFKYVERPIDQHITLQEVKKRVSNCFQGCHRDLYLHVHENLP